MIKINDQILPDIEYFNKVLSKFAGQLSSILKRSVQVPHVQNDTLEELDFTLELKASDIESDESHRFVTDSLLAKINNLPTIDDVRSIASDLDSATIDSVNDKFNRLLSMSAALEQVKNLSIILRSESNLEELLKALSLKANVQDLAIHIKDDCHLTQEDRIALNGILNLADLGGIDWLSDDFNGIKNKPDSLPANGGNADTVGGFSIEHLMNHQVVDYIIGYDDKCDIRINKDQSNASVINQILANNSIAFKKGVYYIGSAISNSYVYGIGTLTGSYIHIYNSKLKYINK